MTDSGIRWRKKGPPLEQEFRRRALWIRDGAAGCRGVRLLGYPDVEGQYTQFEDICTVLFLATPRAGGVCVGCGTSLTRHLWPSPHRIGAQGGGS